MTNGASSRNFWMADNTPAQQITRGNCGKTSAKLSFVSHGIRKGWALAIILVAVGIVCAAYLVWSGLNAVATLEPGMVELHLPSGPTVYLRRQAYSGKPAEVYISSNPDFCAPYDRKHDYKLPPRIQGGPDSPVLISYAGNTVIVHSPEPVVQPSLAQPNSFIVMFEQLTPEAYAVYVKNGHAAADSATSWTRQEVPFGHNTCAL